MTESSPHDNLARQPIGPLLPIVNNGPSRRNVMKGIGLTLGLAAFGKAVWPLTTVPENVSLDEFLQKHYKELTEEDKEHVFTRLENEAREDYGADIAITDPRPIPGVKFGYAINLHNALVPWIWTAVVANVIAAVLFLSPWVFRRAEVLVIACVLAFLAAWIEKGMGLIVPGFVPSTLHEIVEYRPSLTEWKVTAGVWAFGLMIYTIGLKAAITVFARGDVQAATESAE